ncbi:YdeI/OmpD-associated family protein [Amycolatopsis sacchari]|uniref:YdeI/OmpD-associated family protein n=1 Tax=Amycolatopsis sacchari TaxID=115433 RepID=UPI003EBE375C
MRFRAKVELNGKSATGIEVPPDVLAELGGGKRPKVRVRLNGYEYRSSVGSMGGRSLLPVSAEIRAGAGVAAGDEVDVELVLDTEPRTVDLPPDLARALDAVPVSRQAFDKLSYSHQRRYVLWIGEAKTEPTRQRRIAKTVADLSGPS